MQPAIINIFEKAARKAGKVLIRDFGEIENLQIKSKSVYFGLHIGSILHTHAVMSCFVDALSYQTRVFVKCPSRNCTRPALGLAIYIWRSLLCDNSCEGNQVNFLSGFQVFLGHPFWLLL